MIFYDVTAYGAGPEKTAPENGAAIQAAIDAAYAAGGGTVCIPGGRYNSSNIQLKSGVTLHLECGTVLAASTVWHDYVFTHERCSAVEMTGIFYGAPYMAGFLWAENAENIAITGAGIIDGQGAGYTYFPGKDDPEQRRPTLVLLIRCRNIHITDVHLKDPSFYDLHVIKCRRVWVRGVSVDSRDTECGDGLDFDGSEEVHISDCHINSGDDAIGIKATDPDYPCRFFTITNCYLSTIWAGVRIGPESTASHEDMVISNCVFENCGDGLKIQDCSCGTLQRIRISNCVMHDVRRPIFMTVNSYRLSMFDPSIRPKLGGVRDIEIDGIIAEQSRSGEDYSRPCCVISGTMADRIENVTLRNMRIRFAGGIQNWADRTDVPEYIDYSFLYADIFSINGRFPASGLFLRHIRGLKIENCDFEIMQPDVRPMVFAADVDADLDRIQMSGEYGGELVSAESNIRLERCRFCSAALDGELLEKYENAKKISEQTDALFVAWSAALDESEKMPVLKQLPESEWEKDGAVWRIRFRAEQAKLAVFTMYGNMQLFVNGKAAGICRLDDLYGNQIKWPCDLRTLAVSGENTMEIHWDDPDKKTGIDSKLPFAEFRPRAAGFTAPVIING